MIWNLLFTTAILLGLFYLLLEWKDKRNLIKLRRKYSEDQDKSRIDKPKPIIAEPEPKPTIKPEPIPEPKQPSRADKLREKISRSSDPERSSQRGRKPRAEWLLQAETNNGISEDKRESGEVKSEEPLDSDKLTEL